MLIQDTVFGDTEITEQVLIDLINSPSIQRLKGISQLGLPQEYFHHPTFSRYEHSIGVMVLLRKLGASLKEQIAGLLHDASHTAFSHVIDWIIGDPAKDNYQDSIFKQFVDSSEIPSILKKYEINSDEIVDHEIFTLLEQDLPLLCADRVDYTLREIVARGDKEQTELVISNLTTSNGHIVLKNQSAAERFSEFYIKLHHDNWAGVESKTRYHLLAEILKKALDCKHITLEDFKKTDEDIINVLLKSNNSEIINGLNQLRNGFSFKESDTEGEILLRKKFRHIDPEII